VRRIGCSFCLDARSELVPREGEHQRTRLTKIAAYQAPLLEPGAMDTLALIRAQVERCEAEGIEIRCCPEAILGGLATSDHRRSEDQKASRALRTIRGAWHLHEIMRSSA
jgi:hypothetical protein